MSANTQSDLTQLERVLTLIRLLKERKRSVIQLAEHLDISRQTVYRYINLLEAIGYYIDKSENKYFIFEDDKSKQEVFTIEESQLLRESIAALPENNVLRISIERKIKNASEIIPFADELLDKHVSVMIRQLHIAISNQKQVKLIDYQSVNSETTSDRIIEPLQLSQDYSAVTGFELTSNQEKTFKIRRITKIEILENEQINKVKNLGFDIFGMSGSKPISLHLKLSQRAHKLLSEEFPSSRTYIHKGSDIGEFPFDLKLDVFNYAGIGRFCLGLPSEIKVLNEGFKEYLNSKMNGADWV